MAFIGPELSGNSYDGELFAIPEEMVLSQGAMKTKQLMQSSM